jgi:hypothetical protein
MRLWETVEAPADVAPRRSLVTRFELARPALMWGGTWSLACGACAALPWRFDLMGGITLAAAWLAVVPLLGAVWAPASERGTWSKKLVENAALAGVVALLVAAVVGGGVLAMVGLGLGAVVLGYALRRVPPAETGTARSTLEIFVPALAGWFALGGPEQVPAWAVTTSGWLSALGGWIELNWLVPLLFVAFSVVHHGATAAAGQTKMDRRTEIAVGYALAVLALAVADKPLAAGVVALLFIAQWPFQPSADQHGRNRYVHYTQWFAMAAMLAAALGAAGG